MKHQSQAEMQEKLQEFKIEQAAAGEQLGELNATASKAWDDMKSGLDTVMRKLEDSFDKSVSRFK